MAAPVAIIGLTLGCANTLKAIIEKCNHLRVAWKQHTDVEARCMALEKRIEQLKRDMKGVEEQPNHVPSDSAQATTSLKELVREDMKKAEFALGKLSLPREAIEDAEIGAPVQRASGEPSRKRAIHLPKRMKRAQQVCKAAFNIDNVSESITQAEQSLMSAIDRIAEIRANFQRQSLLGKTDMVLQRLPCRCDDEYKAHFDSPPLQSGLVFDFESRHHQSNAHITSEGRLFDAVLRLPGTDDSRGASALGTHGMGGVGKTTALKRICHDERVRGLFTDGVFFLEFGQDADDAKVMGELVRFVHNSGGTKTAEEMREMRQSGKLGDVVNRAAEWLKGHTVLLVCDDLWERKNDELGYVHEMRRVLRDAPTSRLLISTRDRNIANAVTSSPVSFDVLQPHGEKAREILGKAAFGDGWERMLCSAAYETQLDEVLQVCAGLPLALSIAGRGIRSSCVDSRRTAFAVRRYSDALRSGGVRRLQRGANADHPGLKYVVQASLKACHEWGQCEGRNYNMRHFFKSLCVLERQQLIPESALSKYWDLDEDQVDDVVSKFADLNVVRRELFTAPHVGAGWDFEEREHCFGVRLHDLILDLCHQMTSCEEGAQGAHHLRMVQAYSSTVSQLPANESYEQHNTAWWLLFDDGYAYENVARHLVCAGRYTQLGCLLRDCRWSVRRMYVGGWSALDQDFHHLFSSSTHTKHTQCSQHSGHDAMRNLHRLVSRCWHTVSEHHSLFAFNIFAHLSPRERKSACIAGYLASVEKYYLQPWLHPLTKCAGPRDGRQVSIWSMSELVSSVCVLWTAQRVIAASGYNIHVWCNKSQEQLFILKGHASSVHSVAISADGARIVSGLDDGTVQRWDAHTGLPEGDPMEGHTDTVSSVAISADGARIVSGSVDHTVRQWDAHTGLPLGDPMEGHTSMVNSVAITADGARIVSGSEDGTVQRWDAHTGLPLGDAMEGHTEAVNSVAISADGGRIVSGSYDSTVRRWDAHTGLQEGDPMRGHTDWVHSVAISADGARIVSGSSDGTLRRWDAQTGLPVGDPMQGHTNVVSSVAISSDSVRIVSGSFDHTVRWWDTHTGLPVGDPMKGHTNWVNSLVISANGGRIVSGSLDGTVRRWDAHTGLPVGDPMEGHTDMVSSVAISADGARIVSGSLDCTVRRWDAHTGLPDGDPMKGHTDRVTSVAISADGALIVSGSFDSTVRRWDAHTGLPVGDPMEGHTSSVDFVSISADGTRISSSSLYCMVQRWWDANTGLPVGNPAEGHTNRVRSVVIGANAARIESGSADKTVRLCDAQTGQPVSNPMKGHAYSVSSVVGDSMEREDGWKLLGEMKRGVKVSECVENSVVVLPNEAYCHRLIVDENGKCRKVVLGLRNGCVAVCDVRPPLSTLRPL